MFFRVFKSFGTISALVVGRVEIQPGPVRFLSVDFAEVVALPLITSNVKSGLTNATKTSLAGPWYYQFF